MRGREFLMKDAYSFDLDFAGAVVSYRKMMLAYMQHLPAAGAEGDSLMAAESGLIGGEPGATNSSSWRHDRGERGLFTTRRSRRIRLFGSRVFL